MSSILIGGIIGGIIGLIAVVIIFFAKEQKFNKILRTIKDPIEYAALYHYASFKRYKASFKFFDSYGVLYISGNNAYYKTSETGTPISFNLKECTIQQEADWRMLKWFSITTPAGEKYYFDSHKMGAFKNNSDETLKGLTALKAKQAAT
jgi:hypothetical protein